MYINNVRGARTQINSKYKYYATEEQITYPVDGICYTALSVEVKCGTSARISKPPLGSVRY